ncbi:MAG: hypothetical protein JRI55_29270 [Deltaproteobacteria bacterium]|nr:hypothetical protein [Deltaproteobacteria bacterium]
MDDELRTITEQVEAEGPLDIREAIGWITRAAKTLHVVHREGRIHGAITADAILISGSDCEEGEGKLLHPNEAPRDTLYHCAERIIHDTASRADDVWALCVTLYYAMTGKVPFPRGVKDWIDAGKADAPAVAIHRTELAIMDVVLRQLLKPTVEPDPSLTAAMLARQLAAFSPATGDLPALPINAPPSIVPDVDLPAVKIHHAPSIRDAETDPQELKPAPDGPAIIELPMQQLSAAVLMSLPPEPMPPRPTPKVSPPPPRSSPTRLVVTTVLVVLAIQGIAFAIWRLLG